MTDKKYRMFDIHSHILYGIDDGAKNLEMSLAMLQSASRQGVTDIVCSSHSWGDLDVYAENFSTLQKAAVENKIPVNLYTGNELACGEEKLARLAAGLEKGRLRSMADTGWVLVEFHPWISAEELLANVRKLKKATVKATGTPARIIIAHVERYEDLYGNGAAIYRLEAEGCMLQINVYSLVKETNTAVRNFARRMLAEKKVSFIGSDAHRSTHRPVDVMAGLEYIYENCGREYADRVCWGNAENLINKTKADL